MKTQIKEEINKLYRLFKTTPKPNVKNTQQHITTFVYPTSNGSCTSLRREVNKAISSGRCAWCNASETKVQEGFKDNLSKKEYQISALCQNCQDEVFGGDK